MKSAERLNQSIYEQVAKEFGVDKRVCEAIVRSQFRLVKEEIERDDCWGDIQLFFFGNFTVQPTKAAKVKDMPLTKITDKCVKSSSL